MNMVARAKTILFSTAKELAKGKQAQDSATLERARRALPYVRLAIVPVGGTAITKSAKMYTRAKKELVSVLVHA